jgi:AcrR family transcriptional regulator
MFKLADAPAVPPPGPGVRTAKQSRSQLKHLALLEAGRRLLDAQDLGTLSVAQLTRDAGMAVGSFYSRFEDKHAWFAELLRITGDEVLRETQALLAGARWQRADEERKALLIVRHIVAIHRTHRGIFRAAHFDSARSQLYWPQLHAYGRRIGDEVCRAHARRAAGAAPATRGHCAAGGVRHADQRGAARSGADRAERQAHRA